MKWILFALSFALWARGDDGVPNDDVRQRIKPGYSVSPIVGYDPNYQVLVGAAGFRGVGEAPYSDAGLVLYTSTSKFNFAIESRYTRWDAERTFVVFEGVINNFYDPYYGEGNRNSLDNLAELDSLKIMLNGSFHYRLDQRRTVGTYVKSTLRDEYGVNGDRSRRMIGSEFRPLFGLSAAYDARDNIIDTRDGGYVALTTDLGPSFLSTSPAATSVWRTEIDARYFKSPFEWLVLAAQARAGTAVGDGGFIYRYYLGGTDTLRGYRTNRLRGNHYYLGILETRFRFTRWLSAAVFGSFGDVGDKDWSDFKSPQFTKGVGVRIGLPPDFVAKARLDLGISPDQASIYLSFNEAF